MSLMEILNQKCIWKLIRELLSNSGQDFGGLFIFQGSIKEQSSTHRILCLSTQTGWWFEFQMPSLESFPRSAIILQKEDLWEQMYCLAIGRKEHSSIFNYPGSLGVVKAEARLGFPSLSESLCLRPRSGSTYFLLSSVSAPEELHLQARTKKETCKSLGFEVSTCFPSLSLSLKLMLIPLFS